jgi:predicted hydrocarbon binding protein
MNQQNPASFYYSNRLAHVFLCSLEEIIGRNGLNAVLNHANLRTVVNYYPADKNSLLFKFEEISKIQTSLEELYGIRGGHGIALRSGRACLKHGLREFGEELGFTDLAFRLLPQEDKLRIGTETFAEIFNRFSDQRVVVGEDIAHFWWKIERCPICWQRHSDSSLCYLAVGLLQEALYWVSSGKYFNVVETDCIAKGDSACVILIDKTAIE